jgi:hypothetical protein
MELTNDEKYQARFERIESVLEFLANGQKQLLTSQVVLTDEVSKIAAEAVRLAEAEVLLTQAEARLTQAQARLAEEQAKTALSSQETQGKLDALIHMWDDWIRERRAKESGDPPIQ